MSSILPIISTDAFALPAWIQSADRSRCSHTKINKHGWLQTTVWQQIAPDKFVRIKPDGKGVEHTISYHVGRLLGSGHASVYELVPEERNHKVKALKLGAWIDYEMSEKISQKCPSYSNYLKAGLGCKYTIQRRMDFPGKLAAQSLPFCAMLSAMSQLISQLDEIHHAGLLHGDVHQGNIMYHEKEGKFYLIDFEDVEEYCPKNIEHARLYLALHMFIAERCNHPTFACETSMKEEALGIFTWNPEMNPEENKIELLKRIDAFKGKYAKCFPVVIPPSQHHCFIL